MTRTYFNGVGQISSNGITISFVLNDTYDTKPQGIIKNNVIELITELEAAEGTFEYLLTEIKKIKSSRANDGEAIDAPVTRSKETSKNRKSKRPPVGRKIDMSDS